MQERTLTAYEPDFLAMHKVVEVNAEGKDDGQRWRIKECLVFETDVNGDKYVLSADRWYRIDTNLANEVAAFFAGVPAHVMPDALADENEEKYNTRISRAGHNMLCLDRKLVKPTGASSSIEACDFLQSDGAMIHIKDQTSSSRLSHLFNQGTVSARVMKMDGAFRDRLRAKIADQETALGLAGYQALVVDSASVYSESAHLIVFAVICSGVGTGGNRLPFFSLVTFRQAANELRALGYKCAFSWIAKPASTTTKAKRKAKTSPAPATAA